MFTMKTFDTGIGRALFLLTAVVLTVAPWLFGAWESWYFWPFAGLIFLATGGLGLRLCFSARLGVMRLPLTPWLVRLVLCWAPFLAYGLIRAVQAPVRMDAERSILLHLTPFLLGLVIVIGLEADQRRRLWRLLPVNFLLLGLYGVGNHVLAGNAKVLWVPGFPHYQEGYFRATGSYFCPDHFAGLMELGLCVAMAGMVFRDAGRWRRLAWLGLAVVMITGIVLSKSRGGGLVTVLIFGLTLWWGVLAWPARTRMIIRASALVAGLVVLVVVVLAGPRYVQRFKAYPWVRLEQSDRYQMSAAALRGWKSAPLVGIGPGMHQNLWPHFAPSADGDREKGIWPRFLNNGFHSYEAHNDWVQLLEEYGALGVVLFLWATGMTGLALFRGWRRAASGVAGGADPDAAVLPTALLAGAGLALHSAGDFNLQIPATTWVLGAMVALAIAWINDHEGLQGRGWAGTRRSRGGRGG
jgi:O-antigen ligase